MVTFELEGVEIDRCLSCKGTWLDTGELEEISLRAGVPPEELRRALEEAGPGAPSTRRCPRCGKKLREFPLRSASGEAVILDRCPRGHGLWFDRGEIYRAVSLFAGEGGHQGSVARFFSDLLKDEIQHGTNEKGESK